MVFLLTLFVYKVIFCRDFLFTCSFGVRMPKRFMILSNPSEFELIMSLWDRKSGPRSVRFDCIENIEDDADKEVTFEVHILLLRRDRTNSHEWTFRGVIEETNEEVSGLCSTDSEDQGEYVLIFA